MPNINSLFFDSFRGFHAKLKESDIEIILGFSPFREKIVRLIELLDRLKASGRIVTQIELDYTGKAFIKEKSS